MVRPTTLKIHSFHDESFIHGCYIPHKICDNLINFFDGNPDRHVSGVVYGKGDKVDVLHTDDDVKVSTDINLVTEADGIILDDYGRYLGLCIQEYEKKYHQASNMTSYGVTEAINIQKYEPGEGFKKWHFERSGISQQTRCLAFMTYLKNVPHGGTEFLYQKITTPAKKGLTIIWPSDWTHTHRGQISQKHKKYIITGWLNYQFAEIIYHTK